MGKNKGLGRGLDIIFDENSVEEGSNGGISTIRLSQIEPKNDQPRQNFDREALESLAESIAANGVLQPILVRESKNGMYEIIAGERRWRASKPAGLVEIPAVVVEADEVTAAKLAMIENLQREDLNPYEEAQGYADLMKKYSLTQEEIASEVGKSRSAVANSLRLLDLPDDVVSLIVSGELSAGHGRALLGLRDKSKTLALAQRAVEKELSVREVESAVKAANKAPDEEKTAPVRTKVDYLSDLENKVTETLSRRCRIIDTPKKKVIQLEYVDNDDLQALLTAICGKEPIGD
ncbi:MAG: ParB/RepB/Spo0J family partition protein [Clostridia bacterium]|nr:ParB/RepB/Spo0J family partition protein [Clostridia bacterium]